MEQLPVEVIGSILSRLGCARDVVIASSTCRKWREACRKHLHTLAFNSNDLHPSRDITATQLEILITRTIFQTSGLQSLSILIDEVEEFSASTFIPEFSASTVIAWLMYTRETLRRLFYNVRTSPNINILEICGRQKLETLTLAHNTIIGLEPNFQRFPCLKSLSLIHASISLLDLNILLAACPKLEALELISLEIERPGTQVAVVLCSHTLKSIYVASVILDKFMVEADSIESLHLRNCYLKQFDLIGKGTLKYLKFDYTSWVHLDIGETNDNLEVVDVSNFTIVWPTFFQMISRSSKLSKLRVWDVRFDNPDEAVDLEAIAVCFPKLKHLALCYSLREGFVHYDLPGSSSLWNVMVLELGCYVFDYNFSCRVEELLNRCPNLRKMVIFGNVSDVKSHGECHILGNFTTFIVRLMRKYTNVEVQFEYD